MNKRAQENEDEEKGEERREAKMNRVGEKCEIGKDGEMIMRGCGREQDKEGVLNIFFNFLSSAQRRRIFKHLGRYILVCTHSLSVSIDPSNYLSIFHLFLFLNSRMSLSSFNPSSSIFHSHITYFSLYNRTLFPSPPLSSLYILPHHRHLRLLRLLSALHLSIVSFLTPLLLPCLSLLTLSQPIRRRDKSFPRHTLLYNITELL